MIYFEKNIEIWSKTRYRYYPNKAFYIYITDTNIASDIFWIFCSNEKKNNMGALNFYKL